MTKIQNKIEKTEKLLQFTIVLGMFFPIVLEALFNFSGSSQLDVASTVLKSGVMIFVLIVNYLLFEWRKHNLSDRELGYLNCVFYIVIISYALVMLFFSQVANENLTSVNLLTQFYFTVILTGVMYVPVVGVVIMILGKILAILKRS